MSYDEEKLTTLGHLKELAKRVEGDYATKEEMNAAINAAIIGAMEEAY